MSDSFISGLDNLLRLISEDKRTSSFDDADIAYNLNRARSIFVAAIERHTKRVSGPVEARKLLRVVS